MNGQSDNHYDTAGTGSLTRRAFMTSAACAATAAVLGLRPSLAAVGHTDANSALVAMHFWDRNRWVNAAALPHGDHGLAANGVQVTVEDHTTGGRKIYAISALYRIEDAGKAQFVPFYAWSAAPYGSKPATFIVPIACDHGLVLDVQHSPTAGAARVESIYRLELGSAPGRPKLVTGKYLLTAANVNPNNCQVVDGALSGNIPPSCLLVTISPVS